MGYRARQVERVIGLVPANVYRLKIEAENGIGTKWLNVTPGEMEAIQEILERGEAQ